MIAYTIERLVLLLSCSSQIYMLLLPPNRFLYVIYISDCRGKTKLTVRGLVCTVKRSYDLVSPTIYYPLYPCNIYVYAFACAYIL